MIKKKYTEPTNGVLTERMEVTSDEFNKLQAILLNKSKAQTKQQKRKIELMALKITMEDYLKTEEVKELKFAGEFLRSYLKVLDIRQNRFAKYIGIMPSNLSKLLNGERTINTELALVLGNIFDLDPMLWLEIQAKNELIDLASKRRGQFNKYTLDDLITEEPE